MCGGGGGAPVCGEGARGAVWHMWEGKRFISQYGRGGGGQLDGGMVDPSHNNNEFDINSITVNPQYNFLNKIGNDEDSEIVNFFSNNHELPYDSCTFKCEYVDVLSLNNLNNSSKLCIMTLNIQSIQAKFTERKELVFSLCNSNCLPDVICLQEIWQIQDRAEFNLPGYKPLIYKTHRGAERGGGVGIFVINDLDCSVDSASSIFFDRVFESVVIEISNKNIKKLK